MDRKEIKISNSIYIIENNTLYTSVGVQRGCIPTWIDSMPIQISEIRKQINKNQSFIQCIVNYFKDKKNG